MAISKIVYKSSPSATPVTWMDATTATAAAADITAPKTAMLADGVVTTGTGSGGGGITWVSLAKGQYPNGLITLDSTVTQIRGQMFSYNSANNWKVYAPYVTTSSGNEFKMAKNLTHVSMPALTTVNTGYSFYQCTNLIVADIGSADRIINQFFNQATNFNTLILRKSTAITTLGSTNCFSSTNFNNGGSGGTIYIPKSLYDHLGDGTDYDYKSATNWSTLDGYGTITWEKLEGSIYESADWILSV